MGCMSSCMRPTLQRHLRVLVVLVTSRMPLSVLNLNAFEPQVVRPANNMLPTSSPISTSNTPITSQWPASHPSSLPFHIVPGVSNFRDIGGWPILGATDKTTSPSPCRYVRRGIIFRGSDTTRITPAGITKFQELNLKTDFDLRSAQQILNTGGFKDMGEWGIQRVWAPVFADEEYTEERAKERYELYASEDPSVSETKADDAIVVLTKRQGIVQAFVEILTSGASMMKTVMLHLLSSAGLDVAPPALFMHCTTGNNRTGVFVALLLLLLNVPPKYVIEEYTLSEQGLAPTRHINMERLLKKGAFAEYGPDEARRRCERMVGARAESMEALIQEVDRRWGGAERYFRSIVGLSIEEIGIVIQMLTVENSEQDLNLGSAQL